MVPYSVFATNHSNLQIDVHSLSSDVQPKLVIYIATQSLLVEPWPRTGETQEQRAQAATSLYRFSVLLLILFLRNGVETTGCAEEYSAA